MLCLEKMWITNSFADSCKVMVSMLWQPLVTKTNSNTSDKSLSRISSRDHKRTQQEVSAVLESYLYKLHLVYATNN